MTLGISMTLLACLALTAYPARALTLVRNGKSEHAIVLADGASLSEKHAAEELQGFLEEISGAKLPIVGEAAKPAKMIVIGSCETQRALAPEMDIKGMGEEGFAIKTVGPHLVIAGGRQRGTMYGVYAFLEEVLGCRWFTSTVSRIPKMPTIRIGSLDITQKPDFEYREPYYIDAWDPDWAARNRVNGTCTRLDATRGGKIAYNRFCHTFDELVPTDKYLKDHPEYYSLVKGVRQGGQYQGQLCLTNPEVVKIVTETVIRWIEESPETRIVSVTQNDNARYCQCDKCKAVDAEEGSPSGLMLRFVNQVAEEVGKKHPETLIDTFAYRYTQKPPKITKPRPNVRVRLCPLRNCQHHPYQTCDKNKDFMADLNGWHAITNNVLYIWHYNTNFANYLLPLPDLEELAADVPLYKRSGVVGVFFQGSYSAGNGPYGGGGFMDDLKAYMLAKLAWNSSVDARAVRGEFLDGFFGAAAKPIGEYLDLLHEKVRKDNIHGTIFDPVEKAAFLTDDVLARCNQLFDEAEKLAANPDELRRVKHARLSIRFVEVFRQAKRAVSGSPAEKRTALGTLRRFAKDCEADGIKNISESGPIQGWYDGLAAPLRQ